MGVKDLWKILMPTGRPVNPESLQGLVLGVDVSIWLNQAVKGMRDRHGNEISNGHLLVLFNRICKLLHYQIKPVFVFDGPAPPLKLQTLNLRKRRKQKASSAASGLLGKRALKMLEAHALQTVTGQEISLKVAKLGDHGKDEDMFRIPETPGLNLTEEKEESPTYEGESSASRLYLDQLFSSEADTIDIESETFSALPPEMQHDLLLEKKEMQKYSYSNPSILPKKAHDFSDYQLARLMNRSSVTRKLNNVRKSLNASQSACYGISEGKECDIEAKRIESHEGRHYVLIRGKDIGDSSQGESQDESNNFLSMDFRGGAVRHAAHACTKPQENTEEVTPTKGDGFVDSTAASRTRSGLIEFSQALLSSSSDEERENEIHVFEAAEKSIVTVVGDEDQVSVSCGDLRPLLDDEQTNISSPSPDAVSITSSSQQRSPNYKTSETPPTKSNLYHQPEHISEPNPSLTIESVQSQSKTIQSTHNQSNQLQSPSNQSNTVLTRPNESQESSLHSYIVSLPQSTTHPAPQPTDTPQTTSVLSDGKSSDSDSFSDAERVDEGSIAPALGEESEVHVLFQPEIVDTNYTDAVLEEAKDLLHQPTQEAQQVLVEQVLDLERRTAQQEKQSAGVTSVMYEEAQELLRLFGLPYIESPSEAEAQCAALEDLKLTQGTITDDSDVLLFGGQRVYRNMFSPNKELELYFNRDISSLLGLNRDKLVVLAYFLGSDYTEGLEGIGCVNAMELLQTFSGEGLEPLNRIREWNLEAKVKPGLQVNETSLQKKVRLMKLPQNFPNEAIREAYLTPLVDMSTEAFEWGQPDLDLLRQYTSNKFGWNQDQCDKILLPVIRRTNIKQQNSITKYSLPTTVPAGPSQSGIFLKSKRLHKAVKGLTSQTSSGADSPQPDAKDKKKSNRGRGSRRGSRGRGARRGGRTSYKRPCNMLSLKEAKSPKRQKNKKKSSSLSTQALEPSSSSSSSSCSSPSSELEQ